MTDESADRAYHHRRPEPDSQGHTAEEQGLIIRAELAAAGVDVDVPRPTPESTKETALRADEDEADE